MDKEAPKQLIPKGKLPTDWKRRSQFERFSSHAHWDRLGSIAQAHYRPQLNNNSNSNSSSSSSSINIKQIMLSPSTSSTPPLPQQKQNEPTSGRKIICVLEILYSSSSVSHLTIYTDTSPSLLSHEFTTKHGLGERYRISLEKHIRSNIDKYYSGVAKDVNDAGDLDCDERGRMGDAYVEAEVDCACGNSTGGGDNNNDDNNSSKSSSSNNNNNNNNNNTMVRRGKEEKNADTAAAASPGDISSGDKGHSSGVSEHKHALNSPLLQPSALSDTNGKNNRQKHKHKGKSKSKRKSKDKSKSKRESNGKSDRGDDNGELGNATVGANEDKFKNEYGANHSSSRKYTRDATGSNYHNSIAADADAYADMSADSDSDSGEAQKFKIWNSLKSAWSSSAAKYPPQQPNQIHSSSPSARQMSSSIHQFIANSPPGTFPELASERLVKKLYKNCNPSNARRTSSKASKKKKSKKSKTAGTAEQSSDYYVSKKARKISNRLHKQADTIRRRHQSRKDFIDSKEREYIEQNQFSTSKKTKEMASRRSTLMINNFTAEIMHQIAVKTAASTLEPTSLEIGGDNSLVKESDVSDVLNDVGSRLHLEGEVKKQKLAKEMEKTEVQRRQDEMVGCTFKPNLDANSLCLTRNRERSKDVFQSLHDQHVEILGKRLENEKIAELNEDCTFAPKINVISKELADLLDICVDSSSAETAEEDDEGGDDKRKEQPKVRLRITFGSMDVSARVRSLLTNLHL